MHLALGAEQLAPERAREQALADAGRAVEEVGVRGPSASAAPSRRFASGCSLKAANVLTNLLRDPVGLLRAVEGDDAPGEELGQLPVAVGDDAAELVVLTLDPVEPGRVTRARSLVVDVEDERAVGQQAAGDRQVELEHALDAEPARDPW